MNDLTSNRRILIIDDNPEIHKDIEKILGDLHNDSAGLEDMEAQIFGKVKAKTGGARFELESAYQGQEGLERVQQAIAQQRPHAMAFVDVRMPPGWDGVETIEAIWKVCPDLQIVICTAYSDYSWNDLLLRLGETDNLVVLKKPFDNVEVVQLAHALTRKWALAQTARLKLQDLDALVARRTEELESTNKQLRSQMEERLQAERARLLSEERFQRVFMASPVPLVLFTAHSQRYLDANAACQRMLGFQREELIGRCRQDLKLYVDPAKGEQLFELALKQKSFRDQHARLRTRTAQVREVLISGELLDIPGEPCVLYLLNDVTERIRLEEQLRERQKLQAIGQLTSGLTHDFNNLLTIIQGQVALRLTSGQLDASTETFVKEVGQAADRAAALSHQLMGFTSRQVNQPRVLDVNAVVSQLATMLTRLLGETIRLECQLQPSLPNVVADLAGLEQAVMGLALNARDAMPHGGTITVATSLTEVDSAWCARNPQARAGSFVCLLVRDTGLGMEPQVLERIFDPVFTTKPTGKTAGLGLSVIRDIVEKHQGWIEVTSQPGCGATFQIFLPTTETRQVVENNPNQHPNSETVVVVEDEPLLREFMAKVLSQAGYRVIEAANGAEALRLWESQAPNVNLLLTDLVMPEGISGRQLAQKVQKLDGAVQTLYITGYSPRSAETLFFEAHPHQFLQKPFKPAELLAAVKKCLVPGEIPAA